MKLPRINIKLFLASGAVILGFIFPQVASLVNVFTESLNSGSVNDEVFNFAIDPQTKQARFGCSHQL